MITSLIASIRSVFAYWIPDYELLGRRGLAVWLVDARQMDYALGHMSDV
ncbi:hypothetical protein [Paraburkholderia sp. J10-1]|nr:hypothetical protein [Paraburkholderia sp. J10-1]